jgi:tetratricopeptide (TPR) repeat protein
MAPYFISYSSTDGLDQSVALADALAAGFPSIPVWIAKRELRPGVDWDEQIVEAIQRCRGLLLVMTEDSVKPESECKREWTRALSYKKPIIPLRFHVRADLPFRLGARQFIDFTDPFDAAIARLRQHLIWMDSDEGWLHELTERLEDLRYELPHAEAYRQKGIRDDIKDVQREIAERRHAMEDPHGVNQSTNTRIESGLERERETERNSYPDVRVRFVYQPPAVAPSWFHDRHVETARVGDFLKDEALRMLTVAGRAGIGKTAMVCRVLQSLEAGALPDDGGQLKVDGIVYLSAKSASPVTFPDLFAGLVELLPPSRAQLLDAVNTNRHIGVVVKMQQLLDAFPRGRTVVLLDNFENVVDSITGEIQDVDLDAALHAVLTLPQHAVKVILTTQVIPQPLSLVQPGRQAVLELDKGLPSPDAENTLRAIDQDGGAGLRDARDDLLLQAAVRTRGYPRALEALHQILKVDRSTTLEEILSDAEELLPENVVQALVGEAFSRLDPIAQRVMHALAVYAFPVPAAAVDFLLQPYVRGANSAAVLKRLVNMQFARRDRDHYYIHPVDQAYAIGRIPIGTPQDWLTAGEPPYTRASLLRRGAEYCRRIRPEQSTWRSAADLTPLMVEFDLLLSSGDKEGALDVLETVLPYLDKWGQYRRMERLATLLAADAERQIRAIGLGLRGNARMELGETADAMDDLTEALETVGKDGDALQLQSWRLNVAGCHAALGNYAAAAAEYRRVLDGAAPEDTETKVDALLGLGSTAEARDSYSEAELQYLEALHLLASQLATRVDEREGQTFLVPVALPPDIRIESPHVWHSLAGLTWTWEESGEVAFFFGVETATPDSATAVSAQRTVPEAEERDTEVEFIPVRVTTDLARTWMMLAGVYGRMDRLTEAAACCRVALQMFELLDNTDGVAGALDLLRRLVSKADAEHILEAQESELERAREAGNRRAETDLLNQLAECYWVKGRFEEAEAYYVELARHAQELDDTSLRVRSELGLARIELSREQPDAAAQRLEDILKQSPQDLQSRTHILLLLGRVELVRGRRDVAVRHIVSASRGYAALGSLWQQVEAERLLAAVALDHRQYEEAVERLEIAVDLASAIEVPSLLTSSLCDLADAYLQAGMPDEALATADQASKVAPTIELPSTKAEAMVMLGQIRTELTEFDLAEEAYREAATIYESTGDLVQRIRTLHAMARLYELAERRDAEITTARLAWELASTLSEPREKRIARMEFALALSDSGSYREAIEHMETVVRENPTDAIAMCNLGWILYQAEEYERSVHASQRALEIDPDQTMAIRNIGHAFLAMGRPADAEREYRRAIEIRKGGENFKESIRVVKTLLSRKPDVPNGGEMLVLFEEEQRRLDTRNRTTGAPTEA